MSFTKIILSVILFFLSLNMHALEAIEGELSLKYKKNDINNNKEKIIESSKACNADSVDSAPHLFVITKKIKLEKTKCIKNAKNIMSNVGFKNIVEQKNYGVWGIKNGYKGHVLCEEKMAIFNVVGNDDKIVVKYAKELKENF